MTVCESCKDLTDGLGPYCMDCEKEVRELAYGINRQCEDCGGYEMDDGTCDLCYCYDVDDSPPTNSEQGAEK